MATNWDKNSNGIPDSIERATQKKPEGVSGLFGELGNFFTDGARNVSNFAGTLGKYFSSRPQYPQGDGPGDQMFGAPPSTRYRGTGGTTFPKNPKPDAPRETPGPNFESAIQRARELLKSLGLDGGGGLQALNYDPMREEARGRASEYDARLKAMYDQLAGSIRNDAGGISENFQGAIDQSGQRTAGTQQSIQGASDAAQQRNLQQLEALGIGEAAGNIVAQGRDLNTDTARALQDVSQRGQITGDQLGTNQQAALSHNANLAGVAGLEGSTQRARVGNELSQLLAQYDMAEQESRQQAAASQASSQQSAIQTILSLGSNLYGADVNERDYQDALMQAIMEASKPATPGGPDAPTLQYLKELGIEDPELLFKGYSALRPR